METPKEKRILTPEHLEKLKIARVKALAVRQKKASEKNLEKNLGKELLVAEHLNKVETHKEKITDLSKPKKVDSDTESDDIPVIKKKKKLKKKIIVVEDTDSDDEQQQVIYVKRTKPVLNEIPKELPIQQPVPPPVAEPPISIRRNPDQIYAEHYQRNGFQRRY